MSRPTTRNTRRRSDSRSAKPAIERAAGTPRAPRRRGARRVRADRLEVGVLERRGEHAHAVDLLARRHELAHDPRRVVAAGVREDARVPARGLDLDAAGRARARPACRRPPAAPRSMIATRSQTSSTSDSRCEFSSTRDAALAQLLEQRAHGAPPGGVERAGRLVEQQQPRRADQRLRDARAAAACPWTSCRSAGRGRVGEPDELEQLARARPRRPRSRRAAGAARAARRPCTSPGSGTARPGSRARAAPPSSRPGAPHTAAVPAVGRTSPQAIFTSVDLPAPFGPEQADQLALADLEVDAASAWTEP